MASATGANNVLTRFKSVFFIIASPIRRYWGMPVAFFNLLKRINCWERTGTENHQIGGI